MAHTPSYSDMRKTVNVSWTCRRLSYSRTWCWLSHILSHGSDSFLPKHVIRGHDAFDSFLVTPIVGHSWPRLFRSQTCLRHSWTWHVCFLPIPLIFRHGPRSFLLSYVLDSHIRVDMTCLIPSLSLSLLDMAQGTSFLDMSQTFTYLWTWRVWFLLIPLIFRHGPRSFFLRHI